MLTIAQNISQKDGFLLLDFWTLGLGKKNYKTVNTWKSNAHRWRTVKWLFRHNGRMDIWLDDKI